MTTTYLAGRYPHPFAKELNLLSDLLDESPDIDGLDPQPVDVD